MSKNMPCEGDWCASVCGYVSVSACGLSRHNVSLTALGPCAVRMQNDGFAWVTTRVAPLRPSRVKFARKSRQKRFHPQARGEIGKIYSSSPPGLGLAGGGEQDQMLLPELLE